MDEPLADTCGCRGWDGAIVGAEVCCGARGGVVGVRVRWGCPGGCPAALLRGLQAGHGREPLGAARGSQLCHERYVTGVDRLPLVELFGDLSAERLR